MTGMPCSRARVIDGATPVPFWARTMRTSAPLATSASMLLACVSSEDIASFDTYVAPAAVTASLRAGSSHSANRPLLLLHETPTTQPPGDATCASLPSGPPGGTLVAGAPAAGAPVAQAA